MENKFIPGFFVNPPHEQAPDWVIAKGSMKVEDLRDYLGKIEGEWVNFDIKKAKTGKWYAQINDWKPDTTPAPTPVPKPTNPHTQEIPDTEETVELPF